jgi:hypothetical protein
MSTWIYILCITELTFYVIVLFFGCDLPSKIQHHLHAYQERFCNPRRYHKDPQNLAFIGQTVLERFKLELDERYLVWLPLNARL